ncbi:hypothetical protein PT974_11627 [Cladobotryum mycophilum]|uniref:NIMA interactive protein n=1 Tax=Cladobotryum mycophilum TaxID=491253 RepID=A0ABR0S6P7_9HYPO
MVDTGNLQAASVYINNQLLSRGLLRDGQNIDFSRIGYGHGDGSETAGRIIGVINDLILRRDRDAEQRESLSTSMRNLRAENIKHTTDISRLEEKATEAQRKLDIATSSEATMRTQLKSAESAMRGLKDELARTKALVSQARASCATEIKRRDRQIDTLKKQVGEAGRTRGAKSNTAVLTITVTGDVGGDDKAFLRRGGNGTGGEDSLQSETNAFLANMAQTLSEENESLLAAMKQTTEQLREMSGWSGNGDEDAHVVKELSWEELASELNAVMDHMRTILSNPSFVPIEEVMVREEEINRLTAGWLKMESRWEDAVHLMDAWRRRMAVNGKPIDEEDLKIGISLSPVRVNNVEETRDAREPGLHEVKEESDDDDAVLAHSPCPIPGSKQSMPMEEDDEEDGHEESEVEFSGFDDEIPVDEYGVQILPAEELPETTTDYHREASQQSSPSPEPPQLSPLKNSASAGNRRLHANKVREKPTVTITEATIRDSAEEMGMAKPPQRRVKSAALLRPPRRSRPAETSHSLRSSLDDALLPPETEVSQSSGPESQQGEKRTHREIEKSSSLRQSPRKMSRPARPRNSEPPPKQTELTMSAIAAKLAASEQEADAARVRARARAVRAVSSGAQRRTADAPPPERAPRTRSERRSKMVDVDPVKRDPVVVAVPVEQQQERPDKRRRDRRAAKASSRRRSTLNQLELEALMSGNVE